MAAPGTALDMTRTYSGASAVIHYKGGEQETMPLEYHVLYHNTDKVGSNPYEAGRLYDAFGNALTDPFGAPLIAETPDGTSLFAIPGAPSSPSGEASLYLVTQYEYDWLLSDGSEASETDGWYSRAPSAMNLTTLAQDPTSGALTATDQQNIDFSGVGGLWIPCAASQTPWSTHLAGEEDYDFFRRDLVDASVADMTELYFRNTVQASPYGYGYPVEVAVRADGGTSVFKHYSMGHASWEKAQVMPDGRTAYYGDDGTNTGLFMYVADKPGLLSAGTLYAARWDQESDQNGGSAKLTWIRLGHATDYEVARHDRRGVALEHREHDSRVLGPGGSRLYRDPRRHQERRVRQDPPGQGEGGRVPRGPTLRRAAGCDHRVQQDGRGHAQRRGQEGVHRHVLYGKGDDRRTTAGRRTTSASPSSSRAAPTSCRSKMASSTAKASRSRATGSRPAWPGCRS